MYDTVIVRYAEIFLKSEYVKRRLEDRLIENIALVLKREGIDARILRRRHRVYLATDDAIRASEAVKSIFGVSSVSPALKTSDELDEISEKLFGLAEKSVGSGETIAVRAKRDKSYPYTSMDIERRVSSYIVPRLGAKVDLKDPDRTLSIEIGEDGGAFVFDRKLAGVGGLPYKSQGRVISLISSGIDSPVATWMMMRRGCNMICLHLGKPEEVQEIVERLEIFTADRIPLYAVPHEAILEKIAPKAKKYTCVICKRTMLRLAAKLSDIRSAHGIVTGENLGQVASQTLRNLEVLSSVASPVYRPLIGMDKNEIIDKARSIGTYQLADNKKCRYVPKKPATQADEEKIRQIEEEIGILELIEEIAEQWKRK